MCIAALADAGSGHEQPALYRFPAGNGHDPHFAGHAFGNLLIAALTDVSGDFEEAVRESNRVLAVRGSVVPVAGKPITLHAELEDGSTLEGESQIEHARGIKRVWITPDDIRANAEALTAIANADLVVIGPGSLYTSLLPPLLVPGIWRRNGRDTCGSIVRVQRGHALATEGYGVSHHLAALAMHDLSDVVDAVLVNDNTHARQLPSDPAAPVPIHVEARRSRPHNRLARRGRRRQRPPSRLAQADCRDPRAVRRADGRALRASPRQLTGASATDLVAALRAELAGMSPRGAAIDWPSVRAWARLPREEPERP